jgi:hypothetical protein
MFKAMMEGRTQIDLLALPADLAATLMAMEREYLAATRSRPEAS